MSHPLTIDTALRHICTYAQADHQRDEPCCSDDRCKNNVCLRLHSLEEEEEQRYARTQDVEQVAEPHISARQEDCTVPCSNLDRSTRMTLDDHPGQKGEQKYADQAHEELATG